MASRWSLRDILVNLILGLVAFGLLGWALWGSRGQIRTVLARPLDWRLLGSAFVVYMVALVLTFVRWYFLVRALELPFHLRDAIRLGFIGNVYNLVIPGAVGGDLVKAAFLCREQARKTQAVASMVIDRIIGLLGLFLLAAGSGALAWPTAGATVRRLAIVAWGAAGIGLVGLAVLFTPALYRPVERFVAGRGRLETLLTELVAMAGMYRQRLQVVAGAIAMASTGHACYVLAFYLVSRAMFPSLLPTVGEHFLIVPLVLFSTAVPLPFGALGLSEKVSGQLFALVRHPGGVVAMFGFRMIMYLAGLVSLLIYLANAQQVRELREEVAS
jgi:uncharacterized membrane protein YbhN (UPF0104 family)